jgi:hypothetical protein
MRAPSVIVSLVLLVTACAESAAGIREPAAAISESVQYGPTDDRHEVYEATSTIHRAIAERSVMMQMFVDDLDVADPEDVSITYTRTLGEAHDLCDGEPFADQIEPGWCSGTLIDDRHVLTTGHCVDEEVDCDGESWPWVFGFYFEGPGALHRMTIDDIYFCTRIVVSRMDAGGDYAVFELDRPVVGHQPPAIRSDPALLPVGEPVAVIGHPNGIAMKIADNAIVRAHGEDELRSDLDAFSGSSGSGVYDERGELVGLLVSGAADYVENGACSVVNVIDPPPERLGEHVTNIAVPLDALCAAADVSSTLCCDGARCAPGEPDAAVGEDAAAAIDGGIVAVEPSSGCRCGIAARRSARLELALTLALAAIVARGRARARTREELSARRRAGRVPHGWRGRAPYRSPGARGGAG